MKIQIKLAETPEELNQLFQLRHTVYVEQDAYLEPQLDRRICDRFDAMPETYNFIATASGQVIGGARYTQTSPAGTSSDDYYDFASQIPADSMAWGNGSMLCLSREYRGTPVVQTLLTMGYAGALRRHWSHMVTVANPKVELLFRRNGWESLSATLYNHEHKLPFVAMRIDLQNFRESLRRNALALAAGEKLFHELEIDRAAVIPAAA